MYEGALPVTGSAIGVAGAASGLNWLLAIGIVAVVGGILLTRILGRERGDAA